jgi:hypothetical protein
VLNGDEVVLDERNVVVVLPLEHPHDSTVIDPRRQDREQVGKKRRLLLEVEGENLQSEDREDDQHLQAK